MKIHLHQIPIDGLHLEELVSPERLDLPTEGMRTLGPLRVSLDVGLSGGGLFATGHLAIDLEFDCVACLRPFRRTLRVDDLAWQIELTGAESVDLTPYLREDSILALPSHPRCDWDGQTTCPGPGRGAPDETSSGASGNPVWDALDNLKFKKSKE